MDLSPYPAAPMAPSYYSLRRRYTWRGSPRRRRRTGPLPPLPHCRVAVPRGRSRWRRHAGTGPHRLFCGHQGINGGAGSMRLRWGWDRPEYSAKVVETDKNGIARKKDGQGPPVKLLVESRSGGEPWDNEKCCYGCYTEEQNADGTPEGTHFCSNFCGNTLIWFGSYALGSLDSTLGTYIHS